MEESEEKKAVDEKIGVSMEEKTREGELTTTHTDADMYNDGDLVTTHIDELMPETTLEEKMDDIEYQSELLKLETEIENLKKNLEETKRKLVESYGVIEGLNEENRKLNNELSQKDDEMAGLENDFEDLTDLLIKINKLYESHPCLASGWKFVVSNWLMSGSLNRINQWFSELYNLLR